MDFKGVIKKVLPIKSGVSQKGNSWASQDFVIEEVGQRFNQSIVFNVFGQDKIDQFQLTEGLMVTVQLDFQVNEWNDKFFNRVTCYNVLHESTNTAQPTQAAPTNSQPVQPQVAPQQSAQSQQEQTDDLPF